jgi:hypothetical protein
VNLNKLGVIIQNLCDFACSFQPNEILEPFSHRIKATVVSFSLELMKL